MLAPFPKATFYLIPTRAWELGLGALLALAKTPRPSRPEAAVAGALGLAAVLLPVMFYRGTTPFPGPAALAPCLGAAALIWAGGRRETPVRALLSLGPLVAVGRLSYSLYLWHWPLLAYARILNGGAALSAPVAAAAVAGALGLATLSLHYVERPFRSRPPEGPGRRTIFGAGGAGLLGAVALSSLVLAGNGLAGRFGPATRLVFAGAGDMDPDRDRCMNRQPEDGLCALGAPASDGRADFLLWGDSHAGALMPAVGLLGAEAGRHGIFAGKTACAPLLGLDRADQGRGNGCAGFNGAVLAMLRKRTDAPLVILTARWALAAEGYRPAGETDPPALLALPGRAAAAARPEENFPLYDAALWRTVAAIRATGRQVMLIGDVPEIGFSVPDRVGASLRLGLPTPAPPTLAEVTARTGRSEGVLRAVAEGDRGVRYLALSAALCRPVCQIVKDGRSLYVDDDHLSRFGATEAMTPILRPSIWR